MRGRTLIITLTAATSFVTAVAASDAATTDNMIPTGNYLYECYDAAPYEGPVCQTDNAAVDFATESSVTYDVEIRRALAWEFNPTDLTILPGPVATPVFSGSNETDIIYTVRASVPTGASAIYWCNDAISSTKCDQGYVAFKTMTDASTRSTACHETGHAVGLTHGPNAYPAVSIYATVMGCMKYGNGPVDGLGSQNVEMINQLY